MELMYARKNYTTARNSTYSKLQEDNTFGISDMII